MKDPRFESVEWIATTAIRWWETKRPISWGLAEHLANPIVNCSGMREQMLATEVADDVRRFGLPEVLRGAAC